MLVSLKAVNGVFIFQFMQSQDGFIHKGPSMSEKLTPSPLVRKMFALAQPPLSERTHHTSVYFEKS